MYNRSEKTGVIVSQEAGPEHHMYFCKKNIDVNTIIQQELGRENSIMLAPPSVKRTVQAQACLDSFVTERYQHVINLFPPVVTTGSTKVVHV